MEKIFNDKHFWLVVEATKIFYSMEDNKMKHDDMGKYFSG
jgi:hypothetical protein